MAGRGAQLGGGGGVGFYEVAESEQEVCVVGVGAVVVVGSHLQG